MADYMLTEARDGETTERFYALGHVFTKLPSGELSSRRITSTIFPLVEVIRDQDQMRTLVAGMRQGWDAAWPPASPPDVEWVAGYIGGGTPHVWTDAEWATALSRSTATLRLPIFVRVPPTTRDPVVEANFSCDWAEAHGQPKGTLIALDYETSTVQSYLAAFDAQIVKRGYRCVVYGSRSFVMQLPEPSGGRWSATWNNTPHLDAGSVITQYGGLADIDLNVAANSVPFWDTGVDMAFEQSDKDFLITLRDSIKTHADGLYRLLAHPSDGRGNLDDLKTSLSDLQAADLAAAIVTALELQGITVNIDSTQLVADFITAVKSLTVKVV